MSLQNGHTYKYTKTSAITDEFRKNNIKPPEICAFRQAATCVPFQPHKLIGKCGKVIPTFFHNFAA